MAEGVCYALAIGIAFWVRALLRLSSIMANVSAQRLAAAADFLVCALVMSNSMGRLWEQDVWWQLRLGDEMLFHGKGFPMHEEWTYTSGHVPFHNHWWLFCIPFSCLYHLGGVPAWVALRGALCGVLAKLQMMLCSGPERWLLAALSFRTCCKE